MPNVVHKSLRSYIDMLVSELEYNDISPSREWEEVKEKITYLLSKENPFWEVMTAPDSWAETWCFFTMKSFKNWEAVNIGFCIRRNGLRVTCFDEIDGSSFWTTYYEDEESFKSFWLNHQKLADFLYDIFERSIEYANRESHNVAFRS